MAKKIKQFRYYGEGHSNNYPTNISVDTLKKGGTAFSNITSITQLGLQTLPGMRVYLNNADTPIIIGSTGIYELDIEGISEIEAIYFDEVSLNAINNSDTAYLIIDMICEEDE